jgi:hypothetical protein
MEVYSELDEAKYEQDKSPTEKEDIRNARLMGARRARTHRDNTTEWRRGVNTLRRGLKKPTPESDRAKSMVFEPYDDPIHVKAKLSKMRLKTAKNNIVSFREDFDIYDIILSHLLDEGYDEKESNYIMAYFVEQGMPPQEIVARGIANLVGLDRPHPSQVFAQGLRKVLWPNKPKPLQAPTPSNTPKIEPIGKPPSGAKPTSVSQKPNPYRPGATVRATGQTGKFPELERHTSVASRGSGLNPSEIKAQSQKTLGNVAKIGSTIATLRNITPAGVAFSVMEPRPTAKGTLDSAPKIPTKPSEVEKGQTYYDYSSRLGSSQRPSARQKVGQKIVGPKLSASQEFDKVYKNAKQTKGMGSTFTWRGKSYKVS